MKPLPRQLTVFATAVALGMLTVGGGEGPPRGQGSLEAAAAGPGGHNLSRLRVVHEALAPVGESYVEPERVDPDRMYTAALDAAERLVPEVLFQRDGSMLSAQVGAFRTVLEVGEITDMRSLERELRRVASLLQLHLDPGDVPEGDPSLDPFAALEFAMGNGALGTLDPHSALLPPEQSREMDVENRGEFGGLGIHIELRDDRLIVSDALPGKPASRSGVRAGDHIRRIDGQSTINLTLDEAVQLLRGPVGAPIVLDVVHEGDTVVQALSVKRANIKINEVEAFVVGEGLGYIRVPSFHSTVHHDLVAELRRLRQETGGLRGLVLDLRDNPGGYLNQAIAVADTFLDEGEIVSTRGPHDRRPQSEIARVAGTEDPYAMIVLVNANSASASEIVAGALRNNQRALIVGERTFGKGSVQNLHGLPYDAKLKITIAHYLTPGERSIQSVGIPADIEIVPTFVGRRQADGVSIADASVFGRERLKRESDLDAHLEGQSDVVDPPLYMARYHRAVAVSPSRHGDPDVTQDVELAFAVELLEVAPKANRSDLLSAAGPLVRRFAGQGDEAISAAFTVIGVDWTDGPQPAIPELSVRVDVGSAGRLVAGARQDVTVHVTNEGTEPVYRVVAVAHDASILDGQEFFIGRLDPGQTRSWSRTVRLADGWPEEVSRVDLALRDGAGVALGDASARVLVQGRARPHLRWSWHIAGPERLSVGDVVRVGLEVENAGEGDSLGATGRIRNRSGKALDVLVGTLHAGIPRTADGAPCTPSSPSDDACVPVLRAGERWSGSFEVRVTEALSAGYRLDLGIEDERTFDHAAIVREGFYAYYGQEEPVRFSLGGAATTGGATHEAPRIQVTRSAPLEVSGDLVTVSGRVTDDVGLDHVLVFVDDDKVFFEGAPPGRGLTSLPFTASARLSPGSHTITVLARDAEGFSTAHAMVIYRPAALYTAANKPRSER